MNQDINLNCTPLNETLGEQAYIMTNGNQLNVLACDFLRNDFVTPQIRNVHQGLQYYLTLRFDIEKAWENNIKFWVENFDNYIYETSDENAANANLKLTDWIKLTDQKLVDALNSKVFTYELFVERAKEVQAESLEKFKNFAKSNDLTSYLEV